MARKKPAASKNGKRPKAAKKPVPKGKRASPAEQAEKAAAIAARALDRNNWQAALKSLAVALNFDPFRTEWTDLLERAIRTGGAKPVKQFLEKSRGQPYTGFEALKAYAAFRRRAYSTAL